MSLRPLDRKELIAVGEDRLQGGLLQPGPTLVVDEAELVKAWDLSEEAGTVRWMHDEVRDKASVPIVEADVRFALLTSESDLDAVLSQTVVPVDLATGRAAVTLTAPSRPRSC